MTSNETIFDAFVRRQTYLIRYTNGLSADATKLIGNTDEEVEKILIYYAIKLYEIPVNTSKYKTLINKLNVELKKVRAPAYKIIRTQMPDELLELAQAESVSTATIISGAIPLAVPLVFNQPTKTELKDIIKSVTLPDGKTLSESMEALEDSDSKRMVAQMIGALKVGSTPTQAVNTVKQLSIKKAKNNLSAVSTTIAMNTATQSRTELYKKNPNFVQKEIFSATLDGRTTPICMGHSSKVFEIGKGPYPPLHYFCRSIRLPYIDAESYWNKSFDASTEKTLLKSYTQDNNMKNITSRDDLPHGTKTSFDSYARQRRKELIGRLPEKTTYTEFMRRQSVDFQNEILGTQRAKLFRHSGESLDKFVNNSGRFLTIAQLKAKLNL